MAAEASRKSPSATIRRFRPEDADAVTAIAKESPQAADWPTASYRELAGWSGVLALVSESEGKASGFVIGRQVGDAAEVLNLAVTPARRRKGEGGALLKAALEEFRARRVTRVFLEVRESNETAIAFYAKHGFSKVGHRAGYYRDPEEAAILMERKLTG